MAPLHSDFVLIDSLSDSSGICIILLPDILISMFTANYQSLFNCLYFS